MFFEILFFNAIRTLKSEIRIYQAIRSQKVLIM